MLLAERGRLAHQLYYLRESLELPEWISQIQLLQALVYAAWQEQHAAEKERRRQEKAARRQEREEENSARNSQSAPKTTQEGRQAAGGTKRSPKTSRGKSKNLRQDDDTTNLEREGGKRVSDPRHLGEQEPAELGNSRATRNRRGRHVRNEDGDDGFISTDPVSLPR